MANSIRQDLVDLVKPLLPRKWVWYPYATNLDSISVTTAMLRFTGIKPYSIGLWQATYDLLVIEPNTTAGTADDSLDDSLIALLIALDAVPELEWTTGDRGATSDGLNLCFIITLTFNIQK